MGILPAIDFFIILWYYWGSKEDKLILKNYEHRIVYRRRHCRFFGERH